MHFSSDDEDGEILIAFMPLWLYRVALWWKLFISQLQQKKILLIHLLKLNQSPSQEERRIMYYSVSRWIMCVSAAVFWKYL